jgi:multidrug efflux system membrane fusion protein
LQQKPDATHVDISKPIVKTVNVDVFFPGVVESPKIVQIKNRVDGFLDHQYFKDGSLVNKGALLYELDSRPIEADLNSANAQLKSNIADRDNLKIISDRLEKSFKVGGSSEQEYDSAKTNLAKAEAGVDMAKANISKLKLNLSYTKIYAPSSGYIDKSLQNEGSYISQTLLTNIYSSDNLYFSVMLPQEYKNINQADVIVSNNTIKSNLDYCEPAVDQSSNLVKCRYIFKPISKIEINSLGKINLQVKKSGMFIKQTALLQGSKGKTVYVAKDNIAEERNIVTGQWNSNEIEVISGLNMNDDIVVNGISNLKNKSSIVVGE